MKHYLHIDARGKKSFKWWCACGKAEGAGETEEACEVSYNRHIRREQIKQGFRS